MNICGGIYDRPFLYLPRFFTKGVFVDYPVVASKLNDFETHFQNVEFFEFQVQRKMLPKEKPKLSQNIHTWARQRSVPTSMQGRFLKATRKAVKFHRQNQCLFFPKEKTNQSHLDDVWKTFVSSFTSLSLTKLQGITSKCY